MDKMKKNRIGHNCKKLIVHNWRLYVLMLPAVLKIIKEHLEFLDHHGQRLYGNILRHFSAQVLQRM